MKKVIIKSTRLKDIALAVFNVYGFAGRNIFWAISKEYYTFEEIAKYSGVHHTTVIWGIKKVQMPCVIKGA